MTLQTSVPSCNGRPPTEAKQPAALKALLLDQRGQGLEVDLSKDGRDTDVFSLLDDNPINSSK